MSENNKKENESFDFMNMNPGDLMKVVGSMANSLNSQSNNKGNPSTSKVGNKSTSPIPTEMIAMGMKILSDKKKRNFIIGGIAYLLLSGVLANIIWVIQLITLIVKK